MYNNENTIQYINDTSKEYRNKFGQFFTNKQLQEILFKNLPKKHNAKILEPSVGTGEFLYSILKEFKDCHIDAYDIDNKLVELCKNDFNNKNINIQQKDFLSLKPFEKYDYIIGNPPYFEIKDKQEIQKYNNIFFGRVNIYSIFIYLSIQWLKPNGYLAFVVPPSMNNGAYFKKLREYIILNTNIEYINIIEEKMFDASQSVMIIILKKSENNGNYIFRKNKSTIFSQNSLILKNKFNNDYYSLFELGFDVKTGSIVWNQHKDELDSKQGIRLIWGHNIQNNKLILNNKNNRNKKQYIKSDKFETDSIIVVNRIIGNPCNPNFKCALIDDNKPYMVENHVNVIRRTKLDAISLNKLYDKLISSETNNLIKYITGNTQISKNELLHLLPINPK